MAPHPRAGVTAAVFALLAQLPLSAPSPPSEPSAESAPNVIERLLAANQRRQQLLDGYHVERLYHLRNELSQKEAHMKVEVVFDRTTGLAFTIQSQEGSGFLARQVFGRMMEGEKESLEPDAKRRSALTPENYDFTLVGEETIGGRRAYVLEVTPKREDTFLFAGRVWIDAADVALVQAEGAVPKRPSFWTRKIDFRRTFKKVGPFWLPERTESTTEVLLFGSSWVSIENLDYRVRLNQARNTTSP
jgi:hypothetical protein